MTTVTLDIDDTVAAKFYGSRMAIIHDRLDGSKSVVVLAPGEAVLLSNAIRENYPGVKASRLPTL